jgi:hypothetical protein
VIEELASDLVLALSSSAASNIPLFSLVSSSFSLEFSPVCSSSKPLSSAAACGGVS